MKKLLYFFLLHLTIGVLVFSCNTKSSKAKEDAVENLGFLHSEQENKKTFERLNRAIEQNPLDVKNYYKRGLLKGDLIDFKGALPDFEKCVELDPKNSEAWYWLGVTKDMLGDKKGSCADLKKAEELGYEMATEYIKENCK